MIREITTGVLLAIGLSIINTNSDTVPKPVAIADVSEPQSTITESLVIPWIDDLRIDEPSTGVCQCKGYDRPVCYCLKTGIKCGCNLSKGSVWTLTEAGEPIAKTGEYDTPQPAAKQETVIAPKSTVVYRTSNCPAGNCPRPSTAYQRRMVRRSGR